MAAPQNSVSVSRRPPDVEDYIDILRRYRSWIIGPAFAGLVISMVVAYSWADTYVCTASMQIKPGATSDLLPSVSGKMAQRLDQLKLEILGRDNLIALIRNPKLDLYKKEQQRYPVEDIAEEMSRKHVKIIPFATASDSSRGAQAFRIWFEYPDRFKATQVVRELIQDFQTQNVTWQTTEAVSRTTVMDDMVKTARDRLEKDQTELSTFVSQYGQQLPGGLSGISDGGFGAVAANLEVTAKTNQIGELGEKIGREQQNQTLYEGQLMTIKNQEMQAENSLNQTQVVSGQSTAVKNASLIQLDAVIANKKAEIDGLLRKYQPGFADVQKAQGELQALEEHKADLERDEAPAASQATGPQTRQVQNPDAARALSQLQAQETDVRSRMAASKQAIDLYQRKIDGLNKELKETQDQIAASPPLIQKFNALQQQQAMDRQEFERLSQTKDTADHSQSIEEHQAGETLEILEQAITPETPTSPIRPAIVGMGTLIGLGLGIVLAAAKEIKNTSLKNLKDVRAYTNLPVLSSIPLLENALLVRRKRRLAWLAWSSAVIIGSILMCGAVYYHLVLAQQVS